jgi:hypothetical protein
MASYVYRYIVGAKYVQSKGELVGGDISDENTNFEWVLPQVKVSKTSFTMGGGFPRYRLKRQTLIQLSFRPFGGNVWRYSYVSSGIYGDQARFSTEPSSGDQARI